MSIDDLPNRWASSFAQLAMQNTFRVWPSFAEKLCVERSRGSRWGDARELCGDTEEVITVIEGISKLEWSEVNSRRQDDILNLAMEPDCTYLAVTGEQLYEFFPDAVQSVWTLPQLLRSWLADKKPKHTVVPYRDMYNAMQNRHALKVFPCIKTGKPELVSDQVFDTFVCDLIKRDEYAAWMIIGPAEKEDGTKVEGEQMVHTVYPGNLLPGLPDGWNGQLLSLLDAGSYDLTEEGAKESFATWATIGYDLTKIPNYAVKGVNNGLN